MISLYVVRKNDSLEGGLERERERERGREGLPVAPDTS